MGDLETPTTSQPSTSVPVMTIPDINNEPKSILVDAYNHFIQGKRHLLIHDYLSAANSLQEACQFYDIHYGIGADECGEAYLNYGTALLELARQETGVIDGVVHTSVGSQSEEEEEEAEEEDEDSVDGEKADDADGTETKEEEEKGKTDTEEDIADSDEDKKRVEDATATSNDNAETSTTAQESQPAASSSQANDIEPQPGPSSGAPSTSKGAEMDEDEDDNEASNIEVAWEVLCLAKNVFKRSVDQPEKKLKYAETLQKLGEISIEWENNQTAIEHLDECLSLRKEVLPEDDRLIAETYYHLGLAYSFSNQWNHANDCFQGAIQVIENRIENQKKIISSTSPDQTQIITKAEREIEQLEALLPEMRGKIEDSQDQMDNVRKALEAEAIERLKEQQEAAKSQQVKEKPVTDISHLIKRKRPNSESENDPRKAFCSNGHNVVSSDSINISEAGANGSDASVAVEKST